MSTRNKVNKPVILITILILFCGSFFTVYKMATSILKRNEEVNYVENQEEEVKARLKLLRDVQELYYHENHKYASDWESFIDFVKHGELYNIQRNEHISLVDGKESISVTFDTIAGPIIVRDSIIPVAIYPDLNINKLSIVPNFTNEFILRTGTNTDGIAVFEIVDANPVDSVRIKGELDTLRIGSLKKVTTAGNWER